LVVSPWLFAIVIVGAALVCPALMWLGRRGIGPGCAVCSPRRDEGETLEELKTRQRALTRQIDELELHRVAEPAGQTHD